MSHPDPGSLPVPILVPAGGVTETHADETVRALHLRTTYTQALTAAGALPLVYGGPADDPDSLDTALRATAGLLLTGGGDVEPHRFGRPAHPESYGFDPERDEVELRLARLALDRGIPVLGICRGMQVLAVAEGGALVQDIPSERPGALEHRGHGQRRGYDAHTVRLVAGTDAGDLLRAAGGDEILANSFHHQAVEAVPAGWRAVAWAPDGVLEGMERPGGAFAVPVQWHPEDRWARWAPERALFRAFVAAARAYAGQTAAFAARA